MSLPPVTGLQVSTEAQLAMVPQSTQMVPLSNVPAAQAVQVPVPSPMKPGLQVGQMSLLPVVTSQVSTEAQPAMVPQSAQMVPLSKVPEAQAVQVPVPSPMKPGLQVGQMSLLPVATSQVSVAAQPAMVPQSAQVLPLSNVPVPQAVQAAVPSPKVPSSQSGQITPVPSVTEQVSTATQSVIVPQSSQVAPLSKVPEAQAVQAAVPSPTKPGAQEAQVWSAAEVQSKPLAQSEMAVQAVQVAVPSPKKPSAQVGQARPVPVAVSQVSVTGQLAMVPQSSHVAPLAKVPDAHSVQTLGAVPTQTQPDSGVQAAEQPSLPEPLPSSQDSPAVALM